MSPIKSCKILLDECIPYPVKDFFLSKGYIAEHVIDTPHVGKENGELYLIAKEKYQIFVTNDKHFSHPLKFPATSTLGVLYLRITPNHSTYFIQGLENLLFQHELENFVGKKIIVRKIDFEIIGK